MKKILITGGDGFIGSHLAEMLVSKGYHVKALSQYNSFGSGGWLDLVLHARRRVWDHPQRHGSLLAAPFVGRLVDCKPQPAHGKTQPSGPQGVARVMGAAQRLRQAK